MTTTVAKNPSIIGGILLVIGNVIGAGILALPIATAQLGFPYAIGIIFGFWLLMMLGAYYFLEANLALPSGSNLISMSRAALGKPGVFIAWVCNFLVMASLIAAYISGGGDLIKINFHYLGVNVPSWFSSVVFLVIFGFVVSCGIHITDHTNRLFMFAKAIIFFIILFGLAIHFNFATITLVPQKSISASLLILIVISFGFAPIIPSVRHYYKSDVKKIRKIIFWGTFIPFLCYVFWITLVFATLPYHGVGGLENMASSAHPVSDLQIALTQALHISWITQATNIFSAICLITSFFANSIVLTDFIADGLNLYDKGHRKKWLVYFITYFPALCAVLFYKKIFLLGLSIAGVIGVALVLILPGIIVWQLRYSARKMPLSYSVMGGKPLLISLLVVSFILLFLAIFQ